MKSATGCLFELTIVLSDAEATVHLGQRIAVVLEENCVFALSGPLGAGKTTLVRGFLRGLGFTGRVCSPTYTLVEPYDIDGHDIVHIDLYRLSDPEEIEYLGVSDLDDATVLIEWPERGPRLAARADCMLILDYDDEGRRAVLQAHSGTGAALLKRLDALPAACT